MKQSLLFCCVMRAGFVRFTLEHQTSNASTIQLHTRIVSRLHNDHTFHRTRAVTKSLHELFLLTLTADVCFCAVCCGRLQCHLRLTGGTGAPRPDPLQLPELLQTLQSIQSEGRVAFQSEHKQTEETQVQAQTLLTYV